MTKSSRFRFPDINVGWRSLTRGMFRDLSARKWFERLAPTSRLNFCRLTQPRFLRLLSEAAVICSDKAKTQRMPARPTIAGSKTGVSTSMANQVVLPFSRRQMAV